MRVIGLVLCLSCTARVANPVPMEQVRLSHNCRAEVTADSAILTSPPVRRGPWGVGEKRGKDLGTALDYEWRVGWPALAVPGVGFREVNLGHLWEDEPVQRQISLVDLVRRSLVGSVDDRSRIVDEVGMIGFRDSIASVYLTGRRVVFRLLGPSLIQRFFVPRPDSVSFAFEGYGVTLDSCRTRVQYR
jgi:hypothetical protein